MQINFHAKYPVSSFKNVDRLWGGLVALEQKNTSSIILSNLTSMKVEFGQKGNECHKLVIKCVFLSRAKPHYNVGYVE